MTPECQVCPPSNINECSVTRRSSEGDAPDSAHGRQADHASGEHGEGVDDDEQHRGEPVAPTGRVAGQQDLAVDTDGEAAQHLPERADLGDDRQREHSADRAIAAAACAAPATSTGR